MNYSLEELRALATKYLNKQVKKKDLDLKSYDLKIFNKYIELMKKQNARLINRKIFRALFNEFMSELELKMNKLDYLRDVIDLYNNNNTLASRKNKPRGEINSYIIGSKDKRIKVVV